MIRACVEIEGGNCQFSMNGHAGYNPGNDIVCSAASAVAYALAGYLHNAEGHNAEGHIDEMYGRHLERGDVLLHCHGDECVAAAFEMAYVGLAQIAQAYPDNVTVELRGNK